MAAPLRPRDGLRVQGVGNDAVVGDDDPLL
jgi:hypothetical protein